MKRSIILVSLLAHALLQAQEQDSIEADSIQLETVSIIEKLPISVEKISKSKLNERNLGQDIPSLLGNATSVLHSSDTGNGIGYSTIRVRGLGESSINVTLNGVQLNNSESQGVFWVNLPDLASSTSAIYIQRGVGTSTNGMATFGASVNIETQNPSPTAYGDLALSYGSFNTQKYTLQGGTGKILDNRLQLDLRLSHLASDGYIDRAWSDLWSYDVNALYELNSKTSFRFQNMFGKEKTYQAWYGIDRETYEKDRRYNPAGAIYHEDGRITFYDNQTDNYQQNHYFLIWNQKYDNDWKSRFTLHYTKGKGYYEDYRQNDRLSKYKLEHLGSRADLIRQKHLDNDFYGVNIDVENQRLGPFKFFAGLSVNQYVGDHFGRVKWIQNIDWNDLKYNYYLNRATKNQLSSYVKLMYTVDQWELFGDVQYRMVDYKTKYLPNGENDSDDFRPFEAQHHFVNPKVGINFNIDPYQQLYAFYGISQREPKRVDYEGITDEKDNPKVEKLNNVELGYKRIGDLNFTANAFYMGYKNQLVATGQLNDVGTALRKNIGESYRTGVELDLQVPIIHQRLNAFGNVTWSKNINQNYRFENEQGELVTKDTQTAYSPEWISAVGLSVMPFKNFNIVLNNKFVSEQYLSNEEPADGLLDSYWVTDAMLKYSVSTKWLKNLEFTLLLQNLFDKEYVSYGSYYGEPYYFPQAGFNFIGGMNFRF